MESIFKLGILLQVMDMVSGPIQSIMASVDALETKVRKLQPVFDKFTEYGKWVAGAGLVMSIGIGGAIASSATLEQAQRRLKTTIMNELGQVGPEYDRMTALAQRLGTAMAGTNKDMVDMFAALMKQGVSSKQVVNGLGEATAKLATVMEMSYTETAVHVAKFSHSLGIADQDMVKFMDTVQRVSFASGVTLGDLSYTFKHLGGSMKLMGLQGLDASNDIAAMIGMLARVNIEGETAGTAIAMAVNRMAEMTHRMDRKQIKQLLGPILDPRGIKLEFFTDAGAFKGIRPMIAELEKLKPLTEKDRMLVLEKIFRSGAGSTSTLGNLAMLGVQGFDAMVARMQHMADLQTKIDELNKGTLNLWKIMSGTFKNLYMTTGDVFNNLLHIHDLLPELNILFGNIDTWITNHRTLAGAIGMVVFGAAAFLLITGGLLLAIGLGGTLVLKMAMGYGLLVQGLNIAKVAIWGVNAALWANPVTWVVAGLIALTAALIWAYNRFEKVRIAIQFFNFFLGWLLGNLAKLATLDGWLNLFDAGVRIVMSLVNGIKSVAMHPIDAIMGIFKALGHPNAFSGPHLNFFPATDPYYTPQLPTPAYAREVRAPAAIGGSGPRKTAVHIENLHLPNVSDSNSFVSSLQMLVEAHDVN